MKKSLLLICSLFSFSLSAVEIRRLDIVVDNESDIRDLQEVKKYSIDNDIILKVHSFAAKKRFDEFLSKDLGNNEIEARKKLQNRLSRIGDEKLQMMAKSAYSAEIISIRYKLNAVPAYIFNGKEIVYGEMNAKKAIDIFKREKGEE